MRGEILLKSEYWHDRAISYRELGELESAHRCQLRAEDMERFGYIPVLYGYYTEEESSSLNFLQAMSQTQSVFGLQTK